MKTFKDLVFEPHSVSMIYPESKQAIAEFENGYGVSVLFGSCFYSNGINTYEVAILKGEELCYDTEITSDVIGGVSEEEVSEIMAKAQLLK